MFGKDSWPEFRVDITTQEVASLPLSLGLRR